MSQTPIYKALEELPTSGITVRTLQVLDFVVPGGWKNITSFEALIRDITGEDDEAYIQEIGEHAINLYNDTTQHYQKAMRLYRLVDDIDKVAGAAAMAQQVGERFSFLSFLDKITPKDDKTQAIDAAIKLVAEMTNFCLINGIPGDSVKDFAKSLASYAGDDAMRLGAWIAIDGLIPLGPNFVEQIVHKIEETDERSLSSNSLFSKLEGMIPGGSILAKKELILTTLQSAQGTITDFIASKGLTQDRLVATLKGFVDVSDDRLDLLAAALDMSTNYFEHTGTQTIARKVIDRAYGEV